MVFGFTNVIYKWFTSTHFTQCIFFAQGCRYAIIRCELEITLHHIELLKTSIHGNLIRKDIYTRFSVYVSGADG